MREGRRVAICTVVGVVVGTLSTLAWSWQLGLLLGWLAAGGLLLGLVWWAVHDLDAAGTRRLATTEDDSRAAARGVIVVASVVSLAAVLVGLHHAASVSRRMEVALTVASMAAIVTSWLVVHTVFVLRYAHLYYEGDGGVDFPGGVAPDYADFAYLGFTIGMTFQVSDTALVAPAVRRTALRRSLLSYVFGTAIIATTINVLADFVG